MKQNTDLRRFLTVEQTAEILQLSRSKVYQLVESRRLVAHRLDGSIRISEADLEDYLAGCREEREPEQSRIPRPRLKHIRI